MRIKHKPAVHAWMRMARAVNGSPTMIVNLPVAMSDTTQYPGADRWVLAAVYPIDGKAVVIPSTLRCGILVCDWSKFMRYLRRRRQDGLSKDAKARMKAAIRAETKKGL